jgi:hypothetical protein
VTLEVPDNDRHTVVARLRAAGAKLQFSECRYGVVVQAVSLHGVLLSEAIIRDLLELRRVTHLDLSLTNLDDSMLSKLSNLLTLDEINVRHSHVTQEGIGAFGVWRSDCRIVD